MVKDIADMNKAELDLFAAEEYGVELDRRESLSSMRLDLDRALKGRKKDLFKDFFKSGAERKKDIYELHDFLGKSLVDAKRLAFGWWELGLVDYNIARGTIVLRGDIE